MVPQILGKRVLPAQQTLQGVSGELDQQPKKGG